jgi:hypothetical protein
MNVGLMKLVAKVRIRVACLLSGLCQMFNGVLAVVEA